MWVVSLHEPLPGVRHKVFAFFTEAEASEFQSCLCSLNDKLTVSLEPSGEPQDVFPDWSF